MSLLTHVVPNGVGMCMYASRAAVCPHTGYQMLNKSAQRERKTRTKMPGNACVNKKEEGGQDLKILPMNVVLFFQPAVLTDQISSWWESSPNLC